MKKAIAVIFSVALLAAQVITVIPAPTSGSGGAVASVTAGASGAIVITPTTGAVVVDIDDTVLCIATDACDFSGANDVNVNTLSVTLVNPGSSGPTNKLLAKFDSSQKPTVTGTSDSAVQIIGVCNSALAGSTCGTTGSARIVTRGVTACVADNTVTAGDIIIAGTSTAGRCKSNGTSDPASGWVAGYAMTGASVGNDITLFVAPRQVGGGATTTTETRLLIAGYSNGGSYVSITTSNGTGNTYPWGGTIASGNAGAQMTATNDYAVVMTALDGWNGGTVTATVYATLGTGGGGTGQYQYDIQTSCIADDENLVDASFNAAQTVTKTLSSTDYKKWNASAIASLTTTGCAAGEMLRIKATRTAGHTAADIGVLGAIKITYTKTL